MAPKSAVQERTEPPAASADIIVFDARNQHDWLDQSAALLLASHAERGQWPAAVHVRQPPLDGSILALRRPRLWAWMSARCGGHTPVSVHLLDAKRPRQVDLCLATLAALEETRQSSRTLVNASPAGVKPALWKELCAATTLYISAFEAQTHVPEAARAYNAVADQACLLRSLPASCVEATGPIIMAADAGAFSGWHKDGTRVTGANHKDGDVNAVHILTSGHKRWLMYPPRWEAAVTHALTACEPSATFNAFGNMLIDEESLLARVGHRPLVIDAHPGDVVVVAKNVWHAVHTMQPSVSLAADRLLCDQLPELGQRLATSGVLERPLVPAMWAVRATAASIVADIGAGVTLTPRVAHLLRSCAAFIDAQAQAETAALSASEGAKAATQQKSAARGKRCQADSSKDVVLAIDRQMCTCGRAHELSRYCHCCGAEAFNAVWRCSACEWEACVQCGARHAKRTKHKGSGGRACGHASRQLLYVHAPPSEEAKFRKAVAEATSVQTARKKTKR